MIKSEDGRILMHCPHCGRVTLETEPMIDTLEAARYCMHDNHYLYLVREQDLGRLQYLSDEEYFVETKH